MPQLQGGPRTTSHAGMLTISFPVELQWFAWNAKSMALPHGTLIDAQDLARSSFHFSISNAHEGTYGQRSLPPHVQDLRNSTDGKTTTPSRTPEQEQTKKCTCERTLTIAEKVSHARQLCRRDTVSSLRCFD